MTVSTFSMKLKRLEAAFGSTLSKQQAQLWHEKLSVYDDRDIAAGIEHCIENKQRMPSMSEAIAAVDSCQFNRLRNERQGQNREEREAAKSFFKGTLVKDDFGKQCVSLVIKAMSGDMTTQQFLSAADSLGIGTDIRHGRGSYGQYVEQWRLPLDRPIGPTRRRIGEEQIRDIE